MSLLPFVAADETGAFWDCCWWFWFWGAAAFAAAFSVSVKRSFEEGYFDVRRWTKSMLDCV